MNQKPSLQTVEEIASGIYRIEESGVNAYLVVGKEKALLIDTCNGLGNIRTVVKSITPLPIEVVVTHAHTDHIGGATWFKEVYVHKDDISFISKVTSSRTAGKMLILSNPLAKKNGITKKDFKKKKYNPIQLPIEDGHSFDLGDRVIKVIHTPGHTKGSIILLDEESKIMFTGDNVCPALWMFVPGSVSLKTWLKGAKKIYELSKSYTPYCGHMPTPQTQEQIASLIRMTKEILRAQPKNKTFSKIKIYPSRSDVMKEGSVTVWYRTGHVME